MNNYARNGQLMPVILTAATASGVALLVGTLVVVAIKAGAIGDTVDCLTEGVVTQPKAAVAITQGADLYWDNTAKNWTTVVGTNTLAGKAWSTQVSGDATVQVKLKGR